MPEKTIIENFEWTHVWLAWLTALWGGVVSYLRHIQVGHQFSWASATMHMMMSGFAGLLCWLGCVQFEIPGALTAICTGLAGHMGAEFIKIVEMRFRKKIGGACIKTGGQIPDTCANPGPDCTPMNLPPGCPKA